MELLEQIEDYWTDRAEGYSQVNRKNWRVITGQTGDGNWNVIFRKTEQMRPIRFWISEPVQDFFLLFLQRQATR